MRKKTAAVAALLAAALLTGATPAAAQGAFDLMVYPAKLELAAAPGTTQEFSVNVRNLGSDPATMNIYFNDYFIKANNDFVFRKPGHYSYSCSNWLATDAPAMTVPPGATAAKAFRLAVPADAEPGGHYGVIFFEQAPDSGGAPVAARPRIGALVMVTVPGEIVREGRIKDVRVTGTWFWPTRELPLLPKRRVAARVVFQNTGNVHLTVKGSLSYRAAFGWGSGRVELSEITVLPGTTRYLEAVIPHPPLVGSFKVKAVVRYGPSLDVFDTTRKATATFNLFPLSMLALILLAASAAAVLVTWVSRRRKKRAAPAEGSGEDGAAGGASPEPSEEPEEQTAPEGPPPEPPGEPEVRSGPGGTPPCEPEEQTVPEDDSSGSGEAPEECGEGTGAEEDKKKGAGVKPGRRFKERRK